MKPILEIALEYIEHGWSIIPIKPGEKIPLLESWLPFQKRQATKQEVTEWFTKWPNANLAIIVGQISGLLVIDIDDPIEGEKSFRQFFGEIKTLTVKTPRGIHYYFKHPGDKPIHNSIRAAPGLDIKADGGYVLAPPSAGYKWLGGNLIDLPGSAILEVQNKPKVNLSSTDDIPEGGRNNAIAQKAGKLLSMKHSPEETFTICLAYNKAFCRPPLPEHEIRTIVTSIAARDQEKRSKIPVKAGEFVVTKFKDIKEEKIQWLWPGVIPTGKLSLFIGDPGHGKSLLSVSLAAIISAGGHFPDGHKAKVGNVMMVFSEDNAADTVKPRLRLAGADHSKVHYLEVSARMLKLDTDLSKLKDTIEQYQINFLTIDPLSAYLGGINSWKDDEVRRLLAGVGDIATKTDCAILGIMHLNKKVSANAFDRGMGSIAFTAVARSVFLVGAYPEENDTRKVLAPVKANLAEAHKSMTYRIESSEDNYPYIEWGEETSITASDILKSESVGVSTDGQLEQAIEFLKKELRDGEKLATLMFELGTTREGLSEKTIRSAQKQLQIVPRRHLGRSFWRLPVVASEPKQEDPFGF